MRAGEYGVTLAVECSFTLTGAVAVVLRIRPPGAHAAVIEREIPEPYAGTAYTYETVAEDFPVAGTYQLMTEVLFGDRQKLRSKVVKVEVERALEGEGVVVP